MRASLATEGGASSRIELYKRSSLKQEFSLFIKGHREFREGEDVFEVDCRDCENTRNGQCYYFLHNAIPTIMI